MITVRDYQEVDSPAVGRLIASTYGNFNLTFVPVEQRGPYLGPFQFAESDSPDHQREIAEMIAAPFVYVAVNRAGRIVGVLRGSKGRLHSLFVSGDMHRQGVGRQLMLRFEEACRQLGANQIKLASTLLAVPFYQKLGYKRSTGVRTGWSFDGEGFRWQPMKKQLAE